MTSTKPIDVCTLSKADYKAAKRAALAPARVAHEPFELSATDRPDDQCFDARALSPKQYEAAKRAVFGRIATELQQEQDPAVMRMTAAEYAAAKQALIRGA